MAMRRANGDGRVRIAILARAPQPGLAKTRLIPRLGEQGAASLQRWLLQRAVATALAADTGPVELWCAPDERHPDFEVCRALGPLRLHRQPEADLGARMLAALAQTPAQPTLVIGTDCPALTPALLRRAAACLRDGDDDAVVLPAEDGGYVLIGLREAAAAPFAGVAWGGAQVMAQTRARLAALGWRWSEPATLWDVDRPADFDRLAALCPDMLDWLREAA
jgi:rSAM/selenodomain-associated transferase 1